MIFWSLSCVCVFVWDVLNRYNVNRILNKVFLHLFFSVSKTLPDFITLHLVFSAASSTFEMKKASDKCRPFNNSVCAPKCIYKNIEKGAERLQSVDLDE